MNAVIDAADADGGAQLGLTPEEARVMMADPHSPVGKEAQQGFGNSPCAGIGSHPVFDRLIGHPGFTPHVKEFVNGERTAMTGGGGVMQRWPGQASGIHHGGPRRWPINDPSQNDRHLFNFDEEEGTFLCRSVNIMVALNDCPERGGGTSIVVRALPSLCSPVRTFLSAVCLATRSPAATNPSSRTRSKKMKRATLKLFSTPKPTTRAATARASGKAASWMVSQERLRSHSRPAMCSSSSTASCQNHFPPADGIPTTEG